jgi:hypothetical protein
VLFLWVAVEQLGLPVPSEPVLLATGALAGAGSYGFPSLSWSVSPHRWSPT